MDGPGGQTGKMAGADEAPAIELRGISKAFGPVQANKDISLSVAAARSTASSARTARANRP
jgi:hypothetical protein